MVYLEHSGKKFWRCEASAKKSVTTSFGKCGNAGRSIVTDGFSSNAVVKAFVEEKVKLKRKAGYVDAADPVAKKSGKRKQQKAPAPAKVGKKSKTTSSSAANSASTSKAVTPSPKKKAIKSKDSLSAPKKGNTRGLSGHAPPLKNNIGVVDSGVAGIDPALASRVEVHEHLRARLANVDPSKNCDKYYILQVLVQSCTKQSSGDRYRVFTRWGRTGTSGQCQMVGAEDEDAALDIFAKIFESKTGLQWDCAVPGAAPLKDKYEYLKVRATEEGDAEKNGEWYYHLTDDPMGKPDGWYNYDADNEVQMEEIFIEFDDSKQAGRLSKRFITSESSGYTYEVDLLKMIQKNTTSHKVRTIRRTTDGDPPGSTNSDEDEGDRGEDEEAEVEKLARPVDPAAPSSLHGGSVVDEFDCTLNQADLKNNNNKFYRIQLVEDAGTFTVYTRWGRIGETGTSKLLPFQDEDAAVSEFGKKFKSKTGTSWDQRSTTVPKKGKYTLVEMKLEADDGAAAKGSHNSKTRPCTLDGKTKDLIDLIFDEDMFKEAMTKMNIDPAKLPLGALCRSQIDRGMSKLEAIKNEIEGKNRKNTLLDLTSEFYTVIPHAFGRQRGPVLDTVSLVEDKFEMLNTLADIETAQKLQNKSGGVEQKCSLSPHPLDLNYKSLCADLLLMSTSDPDYKHIKTYWEKTSSTGYRGMELADIWRLDRHSESERFAKHDKLGNRRLLWHGTNVAVVAAILKSGLRIMPHSGGRVGKGIYLADQHSKSAGYTCGARGGTVMFLVEAALGKQKVIRADDHTLVEAPSGFDSVLAIGQHAPPDKKDVHLTIDGKSVAVPQAAPKPVKGADRSSFSQSEFLLYEESLHRIRFVLMFK